MSDTMQNEPARQDRGYFTARAEAERRLAETASDERAKAVHEQLAAEYEAKARDGAAND